MSKPPSARGAVVLCGGRSLRMGQDKATLLLAGVTLLARTVRLVSQVVQPERIVCVAAADQLLPTIPAAIRVVRDPLPDQGPLAALAVGLRALQETEETEATCEAALVVACDTPLLAAPLVELLFDSLGGHDAVVPEVDERLQPLVAVYRLGVADAAERLIASGQQSLRSLIAQIDARQIGEEALRQADPDLLSFQNCNNPASLSRAEALLESL